MNTNLIGDGLIDGYPVLSMQLIVVTGKNTDARCVSKAILHGWVFKSTKNF